MGSSDEVCDSIMTRSAYSHKKFANRRMTRSAFMELQKQRQPHGKPLLLLQPKKIKKPKPVRVPLSERHRLYRNFTPEEREAYTKRLTESEGFDVGELPPGIVISNAIREIPLDDKVTMADSIKSAEAGLTSYNQDNQTNYKLVKIVRVCYGPALGVNYYVTFKAKQGGITRRFQTCVRHFMGMMDVELCREEKKPGLRETSQQS